MCVCLDDFNFISTDSAEIHDYRSLTMQEVEMAETRQNENQIK